jgi:hypothetical protein
MAHVIRLRGVSMMKTHIPKYNQNSVINMAEIWRVVQLLLSVPSVEQNQRAKPNAECRLTPNFQNRLGGFKRVLHQSLHKLW